MSGIRHVNGKIVVGQVGHRFTEEHLYRRHMLPKFRCNRCRQDLKSAFNLNEHQRSDVICQRQNQEPEDEGIDEEQERLLRARKRKNGKARQKGEEDKWVEMYKIIFPHDDPIPSPYAELYSFEGFARREFSRRMRPRMESLIDGILEQTLTSEAITDVANSVFQGIMETFRANQGQAACQSKAEGSPSRSPSPEGVRIEGAPHVPQYNDGFEHNPNPDIEINIEEILKSLDDDQYLDLEPWPTEIDAVNTFQPLGLQFEQYNKANA
ncbi:hypothetical protein NW762_006951 [Fusarium torreyae]|uniref:C2H2-type domain-containing protein n=1 Tax=Fusarium torreyae TaxID=1237075 RepID=A0A9W8RYM1_9HYPO|nr:hypothetical protein NW762_006951 [Fusarium torreyae]